MKLILNSNLRILNSKCNNSEIKKIEREREKAARKQGSKQGRKGKL